MANPPEPGRDSTGDETTESYPMVPDDPETETVVINKSEGQDTEADPETQRSERRFTAPGFDAKETTVITASPDPATEVFAPPPGEPPAPRETHPKPAVPQSIPPRFGEQLRNRPKFRSNFSWGWVLALVVLVLALAAIAILGTVLLTRENHSKVSQEDRVRHTIQTFDTAVQKGDLTLLRTLTCGNARDDYVDYDERQWEETYRRVSAARQYPVIASIDQVVVNGQHAEANVTTFMAYDPQVRSTRSLDLQYRDDQWKICQSSSG